MIFIRNALIFVFLLTFIPSLSYAQKNATQGAPEQKEPRKTNQSVKSLPTCVDFTEVYGRVVSGTNASSEDKEEMLSLAAMTMGYVSALQDLYGSRLVGLSSKANEWTLLEGINRFCEDNPQINFQRAVRNIPAILQTMEALRTQEFERCTAFIEQTKANICLPVCKEKK